MENIDTLNKLILICGKRNSGKSQLLRYIVSEEKDKYHQIYLFCPTEKINSFYEGIIKPENIFNEYDENWTNTLMDKLSKINGNVKQEDAKHVLLILDDCCSDTNFRQSPSFKILCTRGRHFKLSLIITSQYLRQLAPVSRSNADWILVSQMNSQSNKILADEFLHGTLTKKEFISMYYKATSNYGFLVINNNCAKKNDDVNEIYGIVRTPDNYLNM